MSTKRFIVGTVVGGMTAFVAGYAMFLLPPLSRFYTYAMSAGSATGVARESPMLWAVLLGALSYAALVTLAIASRPGPTSAAGGIVIGAIVGFLLWLTANLMFFGISNVGNVASTLIDPLLELVPGAAAGGAVAVAFGRMRPARLQVNVEVGIEEAPKAAKTAA
jgi:hypothetical protein